MSVSERGRESEREGDSERASEQARNAQVLGYVLICKHPLGPARPALQ